MPGEVVYRVPSLSLPDTRGRQQTNWTARRSVSSSSGHRPSIRRSSHPHQRRDYRADLPSSRRHSTGDRAGSRARGDVSPEQIESRLQDRFHLLTAGARTAVVRQRTLEAHLEWSYNLLSDHERLLLNRVSVFPASWTIDAAEAVCAGEPIRTAEVLDLLSRLVDKSLGGVRRSPGTEQRRYRLLDTVHEYSTAQLAEDDRP